MNEPFDGKVQIVKFRARDHKCYFLCYVCGMPYPNEDWKGDVLRSHAICNSCALDLDFFISNKYEATIARELTHDLRTATKGGV